MLDRGAPSKTIKVTNKCRKQWWETGKEPGSTGFLNINERHKRLKETSITDCWFITKKQSPSKKIKECNKGTKMLFSNITSNKKGTPKICGKFTNIDPYSDALMTNEVLEMMSPIKNKSCELDTIPVTLLKKILRRCIDTIMQLVNISFTMGEFCLEWKTAVVRQLLKRPGLEILHKNYRLVLNLCFLSNLVKSMLKQLMQQCERYNLLPDFKSAYRRKQRQPHKDG